MEQDYAFEQGDAYEHGHASKQGDASEQSNAAEQMTQSPPPLTKLQPIWIDTNISDITPQQLLASLKAEYVSSFFDFVLAHHLLLFTERQLVLTRLHLATFGDSRDYLLENVYLHVTRLSLSDDQKVWLSAVLSYAEKRTIIREGNATGS